jgi:Flp pilus assembly pilin Flp
MTRLLKKLWSDDGGALIAAEYLFVATILVIGIVVGLTNVRDAINAELTALGNAYLTLSVGYTISGVSGCSASTDGSQAIFVPHLLTGPIHTPPVSVQEVDVLPCQ